jgi:hypothetical protein
MVFLLAAALSAGCTTSYRLRAAYPMSSETVACVSKCRSLPTFDRACLARCPGVSDEEGRCEGLPPPCVDRDEVRGGRTFAALMGGVFGSVAALFVLGALLGGGS